MTRSGIPLDTLPTAPTLREAAQALADVTDERDDCTCPICVQTRVLRDALAATPEPALSDDEDAITEEDLREWFAEAVETWFDLGVEGNQCGSRIDLAYDVADHMIKQMGQMDRVRALTSGVRSDDRTVIRKAADYIEADRAWRDAWHPYPTAEQIEQSARLKNIAQMARMRFGDEDLAALKRIGGE